jgi:hypothetical protein
MVYEQIGIRTSRHDDGAVGCLSAGADGGEDVVRRRRRDVAVGSTQDTPGDASKLQRVRSDLVVDGEIN